MYTDFCIDSRLPDGWSQSLNHSVEGSDPIKGTDIFSCSFLSINL